jgi:hypothetical protein
MHLENILQKIKFRKEFFMGILGDLFTVLLEIPTKSGSNTTSWQGRAFSSSEARKKAQASKPGHKVKHVRNDSKLWKK